MPHRRACHSSCKTCAPLLTILAPLLASLLLVSVSAADWSAAPQTEAKRRNSGLNDRVLLVGSAESLHAALADTSVAEILVAGPLQLAAPVFNATPAGRLVLDREVVLRGAAAGAGLHVDRAGEGSREAPALGWLQWSNRISFISLELKGLLKTDFNTTVYIPQAERFSLWNGERLFEAENETLSGEIFLRNCSIEFELDVESVMRNGVQAIENYGDIQGISELRTSRRSPTNYVLSGSSIAPLFESELEMTVMDMMLLSFNIYLVTSRLGAPAHVLVLWGNDSLHLLWFYGMGLYIFDCRITLPANTAAIARALKAEDQLLLLGGDVIEGGGAADSLRASVLAEFQGVERSDCQSIYKTDPTWAKAAEQQGLQLPDSFDRFLLGRDYVGTTNVTRSGRPCLAWRDVDIPGAEHDFSGIEGNACR